MTTTDRYLRVSAEPIIRSVERRGGIIEVLRLTPTVGHFNRRTPPTPEQKRWKRAWARMRQEGTVTIGTADQFCISVLGVNPSLVYGQEWWEQ